MRTFEGWIGAIKSGGNAEINDFNYACIPIEDDIGLCLSKVWDKLLYLPKSKVLRSGLPFEQL